jgi:uncharacterized protein (DUF488 family)
MYSIETKASLDAFPTEHIAELNTFKWGVAKRSYQDFEALGYTMLYRYFKNALTRYRKEHNIVMERTPNKYYSPRTHPPSSPE